MRTLITFFLLFTTPLVSFAQNKYPIKLDHKWGFINETGRVITVPKYDRIGKELFYRRTVGSRQTSIRSNIYTVELDDKLGLVGRQGKELLAPKYYAIQLLNDTTFLVRETPNAEHPTVVNARGERLVEGKFERILFVKKGYYKVKKNGQWGIQKAAKEMTIPTVYPQLQPQLKGKGYVAFRKEKTYGLMDLDGNTILPDNFEQVKVLNDTFFITKNSHKVEFWNEQQQSFLDSNYINFTIIHPTLIQLETKNKLQTLYSVTQKKTLMPAGQYQQFRPVPNTDYIYIYAHQKVGLMDKEGQVIVAPTFTQMEHLQGELFKIGRPQSYGIFSTTNGVTLPQKYKVISRFTGNIALVKKYKFWGAINQKGQLIIPTQYELLKQDGNYVKAFKKNQETLTYATVDRYSPEMDLYQLNEVGEVVNQEDFTDVYTIRVGYQLGVMDYPEGQASLDGRLQSAVTTDPVVRRNPEIQVNSPFEWYLDKESKLWGLRHRFEDYIIKSPAYSYVRHIPFTDLSIVASTDKKDLIDSVLDTLLDNYNDSLGIAGLALFSHHKGGFISDFNYNGLHIDDGRNSSKTIRFINKEGLFGLLPIENNELKKDHHQEPLFTYIGDFKNGLAPACIGGERLKEAEGDSCFAPLSMNRLVQSFCIQRDRLNTNTDADYNIKEGKWGFINPQGEWVIEPIYEYVETFKNEVALCKKGDFWGMIDRTKKELLPFEYENISRFPGNRYKLTKTNYQPVYFDYRGRVLLDKKYVRFEPFSEDWCAVQTRDSLWGYVDKNGEEVLACQYEMARSFGQGRAAVKEKGQWFFIDKQGQKIWTLPKGVQNVGKYSNGKVWFKNKKGLYGFYDWDGNVFSKPKYSVAFDFKNGLARAAFKAKTGLIDTTGRYILSPKHYDLIWEFDENGLARAYEENDGLVGLINQKGEVIVDMKYREIAPFENGYAKVLSSKGFGYIDMAGKEVIPAVYEAVGEISEGLVAVSPFNEYEWTYMNMEHQRAIKQKFISANAFMNGQAIVSQIVEGEFKLFQINTKGNVLINLTSVGEVLHQSEGITGIKVGKTEENPDIREYCYYLNPQSELLFAQEFKEIGPFKNGLAIVQFKNRRWGLINRFGHIVIEAKFHKMEAHSESLVLAFSKDLYGISDANGQIILSPKFDRLNRFGQLFRVEKDDAIGYLDGSGNWVWELSR